MWNYAELQCFSGTTTSLNGTHCLSNNDNITLNKSIFTFSLVHLFIFAFRFLFSDFQFPISDFRQIEKEIEHVFRIINTEYADIRVALPEVIESKENTIDKIENR